MWHPHWRLNDLRLRMAFDWDHLQGIKASGSRTEVEGHHINFGRTNLGSLPGVGRRLTIPWRCEHSIDASAPLAPLLISGSAHHYKTLQNEEHFYRTFTILCQVQWKQNSEPVWHRRWSENPRVWICSYRRWEHCGMKVWTRVFALFAESQTFQGLITVHTSSVKYQ